MAYTPFYKSSSEMNRAVNNGNNNSLPTVSQALDSVRAYQWEITFGSIPALNGIVGKPLTLAAKSVSQTGFSTEDIEVHRVNDKVFYPGKASTEECTVIFDNLYGPKIGTILYNWMSTIYNPATGEFTQNRLVAATLNGQPQNDFKTTADIVQLDNKGLPISHTKLIGVYPKSWKQAEFNYSTNEFHTIELVLRYDFVIQKADTNLGV